MSGNPQTLESAGTGFFITKNGYLLTNYHVISQASKVSVATPKGLLSAKLIAVDEIHDMAVLKVEGRFDPLPLTYSRSITLGHPVFTIGYPNTQVQGVQQKYTKGTISSLGGIKDDSRQFQISVPIQPGNSGGPLVDQQGNVVGVVVGRLRDIRVLKQSGSLPQNVGYAVKSSFALAFLETLPDLGSKLKRPRAAGTATQREIVRNVQDATVRILVNQVQTTNTSSRSGPQPPASLNGVSEIRRVRGNSSVQPRARQITP